MREYRLKMDGYGISKNAYDELKAFCRQYGEKKTRAAALAGVSGATITGMPKGSRIGNPVARAAEQRERLLADCEQIERAALLACGGKFYGALILNCCHNVAASDIDPEVLPTSNRSAFFSARRAFFWTLHQIRQGRGDFGTLGAIEK